MRLQGVFAPISTPFANDGEVDHAALRSNLSRYVEAGLDGFVVAGSTGEAALLSPEERLQIFETARAAGDGKLLIAGAGVESVRETLGLIRKAAALQYDATLVLTPHYYRAQMLRPESQTAFFRSVADGSPLPVLIYNFPQMTGIDLSLETVVELAAHPNIAGMKESSADLAKIQSLISAVPTGFPILVGSSAKFHDCLCLGAAGGILAIANAVPHSARSIFERFVAGDVAGSRAVQCSIGDGASVAIRFGIQGLKYAMDLKGFHGGPGRPPLLPLDSQQKTEIEALFHTVGA